MIPQRNAGSWNSSSRSIRPIRRLSDRLAQLAEKDGQPARAAKFLHKKDDIDPLRERYQKLYDRTQPMRDAEEMARLAEQLGRGFEARVFLTLAISDEPEREDLRRDLSRLVQTARPRDAVDGIFLNMNGMMQSRAQSSRRKNDAAESARRTSPQSGRIADVP